MGEVVSLQTREVLQVDEPEAAEVEPQSYIEWRDDVVCALLDLADDLSEAEEPDEADRIMAKVIKRLSTTPSYKGDG